MKRIIAAVLTLVMAMSLLAGCGSFKCDLCKKESDGEEHTVEANGKEYSLCDDCKALFDLGASIG